MERTPHSCPVCNGTGKVPAGFYDLHNTDHSTTPTTPETCRTCNGEGIVWNVSTGTKDRVTKFSTY